MYGEETESLKQSLDNVRGQLQERSAALDLAQRQQHDLQKQLEEAESEKERLVQAEASKGEASSRQAEELKGMAEKEYAAAR